MHSNVNRIRVTNIHYVSYRQCSSRVPAIVRSTDCWSQLPAAQRQAWSVLGWTADSWDGRTLAPVSEFKTWDDLDNREKSAATYGLGYTKESWNEETDDDIIEHVEAPVTEAPTSQDSRTSDVLQKVLGAARTVLPVMKTAAQLAPRRYRGVLGEVLDVVSHIDDAAVTSAHGGSISVSGTEDVVFLDDSGSMLGNLGRAHNLWSDIAARLQATPTRIVKFGSRKHVIFPRVDTFSATAVALSWDASSGRTFMWEMILNDVLSTYSPGGGRLRVFVITDGADTDSGGPYNGMEGMDPLMHALRDAGFNVEFHIVFVSSPVEQLVQKTLKYVLNSPDSDVLARYKDLALATGGGFLHLDGNETTEDRDSFLAHVEDLNAERLRIASKREYEQRLQLGEGTRFDWYQKGHK